MNIRISIKWKILLFFSLILIPYIIFTVINYAQISQVKEISDHGLPRGNALIHMQEFTEILRSTEGQIDKFFLVGSVENKNKAYENIEELILLCEDLQKNSAEQFQESISNMKQDLISLREYISSINPESIGVSAGELNRKMFETYSLITKIKDDQQNYIKIINEQLNRDNINQNLLLSSIIKNKIILGFFIIFVIIITTLLLSGMISKPIIKLRDAAKKIGEGDLKYSVKIKSKDELGDLAASFSQMTKNIKKSNEEILKRTKELTKANKELKKLDVAKSEFISIASHELRTPLTSIISMMELLLTDNNLSKNKKKKMTNIAFEESKKLLYLVRGILDLSKMNAGKVSFDFVDGDIRKIIDSVYKEQNILAKKKGITLKKRYPSKLPKISFDQVRIGECLSNLTYNAIKSIHTKKGKIIIDVKKEKDMLKISVEDNGQGIPKEKIKEMFKPFMQVENSKKHHEGTGLGLAITKKIILAHQGKIKVNSKVNKGTTITIYLPVNKKR